MIFLNDIPTPFDFEAGKTAKELGIDTNRKFVVMATTQNDVLAGFLCGDIVELSGEDCHCPLFTNERGVQWRMFWYQLAYADDVAEPACDEKPYVPMVGDRVSLEVEVVESYHNNDLFLKPVMSVQIAGRYTYSIEEHVLLAANPTLLHRAGPRTISRAEAETMIAEKLGESVIIKCDD